MNPLRTTTRLRIVSGLKHFLAIVMALVLFGIGIVMLWTNIKTLTMPIMIGASVFIGVGILIAIPSDARQAIDYASEKVSKFKKSPTPPEGGA